MDVLSDLLKLVTLKGAVFYNAEFSAPWSFRSPHSRVIAPYVGADSSHVIIYHFVLEGSAWGEIENGGRVELQPGDIVVFPHGHPHRVGSGSGSEPIDTSKQLDQMFAQGLVPVRMGGGGESTRFVCGFMSCDPQISRLLLETLPPMVRVNIRNDAAGEWLEKSILFTVSNSGPPRAGGEAVLAKLSEALFIETLRRYLNGLPAADTGWLAGARDPEIGKALGLLHRRPADPWTIADLASSVGISRAVLAERFRQLLGEPPIAYLTRWRLQLGARLLLNSSRGIAEIAAEVGYDSEAAFNRAFKRRFGLPPARYRRDAKAVVAVAG